MKHYLQQKYWSVELICFPVFLHDEGNPHKWQVVWDAILERSLPWSVSCDWSFGRLQDTHLNVPIIGVLVT
jgi:hypothetical protein